jgi:TolA-binding protein
MFERTASFGVGSRFLRRAGLLCLALLLVGIRLPAAEPTAAERRELATANRALEDVPDFADGLYTAFIAQYPDSSLLPEARLGQAQALRLQSKLDAALAVLREHVPRAGVLADQYRYWIGYNLFSKGELAAAETAFAELITTHPESPEVLGAAELQARSFFRRQDYERTIALLADPAGAFEKARASNPAKEPAIRGLLLLAEAQFELGKHSEAEATLARLPAENLPTSAAWRQAALRARVLAATDRAAEAHASMADVITKALATERLELVAESHALNGGILEQLGRPAEALAAYEPNLKPEIPLNWRRHALGRVVTLAQATSGPAGAVEKLTLLSAQGLDAPAPDLVQLSLGELRLRMFHELPLAERAAVPQFSPAASNHLFAALASFTNVTGRFTNSPYLGKAWLDRGWCHWELAQWTEAVTSFEEATRRLPVGFDQATAVFKLGDARYRLGEFAPALTNYSRLVREYGEEPRVKSGLLDQAYYQMIQAAIQTGDQPAAEFAVKALLAQFPGNFYAERGLLLVGQFLNDIREPAKSRAVLENFDSRFQGSSLAPEIDLALARTFELEGKWPEAAAIYDKWLGLYTNHTSRASAEFHRAFARSNARQVEPAFAGFTNFVATYPQHPLAPKAFLWLGNHFNAAQEFAQAELHYQLLFSGPHHTNWPVSRLTYEARISASRAALQRQLYGDASFYLTNLLNMAVCPPGDPRPVRADCCPRDTYAEALFAYGDVLVADLTADAGRFVKARTAFRRLVTDFPESPLVPAALGRIGDNNVALGAFDDAAKAYRDCLRDARATVGERSRAEIGLGQALEKEAATRPAAEQGDLLARARDHYLNVLYGRNLNVEAGEVTEARWQQLAGESAARLAEGRGDWETAARLYERLRELLPVLADYYTPLIRRMEERARLSG